MIAAGKGGKTAIVIGVQTKGNDLAGAVAFAKHAAQHGANAICSLPPEGDNAAIVAYYKAIGAATDLPSSSRPSGTSQWIWWSSCSTKFLPYRW